MARPTFASLLPGLIAAMAFILSLFGTVYCKFLSFTSTDSNTAEPITLSFGIWYYQSWTVVDSSVQGTVVLETCNNYPDGTYFDPKWKTSQAFSTMCLIIGGVVTFWALLAGCLYPSKQTYQAGGLIYMFCTFCSGLALILLDSNACHDNGLMTAVASSTNNVNATFPNSCSMGPGASCTIVATILWLMAALAAIKVDPPKRSPITTETQDVTYTKTTGADGAAVVSENVVKGTPVVVGQEGQEVEQAV